MVSYTYLTMSIYELHVLQSKYNAKLKFVNENWH